MQLKSVELFAGAGGLGLGIAQAGFQHQLVIERDKNACDTLRLNFGERENHKWPLFEGDVRHFDFRSFNGRVDFVSGGPPCQPFSIGGKHQGFRDHRDMFPAAARIVNLLEPKAFLFENVKGLLRESFAKYFQYILLQLKYPEINKKSNEDWPRHLSRLEEYHTKGRYKGLYYRVLFKLVNAANYGIPQKRERVIIVGFRSDIHEEWSFPSPTHSEDALLRSQFITEEYWDRHRIIKRYRPAKPRYLTNRLDLPEHRQPWLTVRDSLADLPDPRDNEAQEIPDHKFQKGAKLYPGHTGSPLDEPAKTLKAGGHGVPGGENMLVNNGRVRYFTTREAARLQTFPDWFIFNSSWTESMRQIGNAVPVKLANIVATSIAYSLRHLDSNQVRES